MFNKIFIDNFARIIIRTWLKSICTNIDIHNLKLIINKKYFGKVDYIYLEAENLIYQELYINKIIIEITDCYLKFNYRNHIVYSKDLIISSFLTIDNENLKKIFFSKKWAILKKNIEKDLTEGQLVSNIIINNEHISFFYNRYKLNKEIFLALNLRENSIFLENINNKNKICIPLDKNIKLNSCYIKNEEINIELSSKVLFDS